MFCRMKIGLWVIMCVSALTACSTKGLHETVREADSVWQAGQSYSDSTRLAQAYVTLGKWRVIYPDEYAHACYHYGRMLRENDDPVSAMQVFINATHTRTHDYHILGRVYNNIGDICHQAGEYALSYDMFEKSGHMFLRNDDTLSYDYCLTDMAFELAMLAKKDSVYTLLDKVEENCFDSNVLIRIQEIRAEVCLRKHEYDSALCYAYKTCNKDSTSTLAQLIIAQTYSRIGKKDSAVFYAERLLELSSNPADIHNALFILTNDDERKDKASIRETASKRADNQKLLEIQHGEFTQASLLLIQDLKREPDLTWLYASIATLIIAAIILFIFINRRRKQHQLLSQKQTAYSRKRQTDLEICCTALHNSKNLKKDLDWENYDAMCNIANARLGGIADKLKSYPNITPGDVKVCLLVLLDLPYDDIATMLNLSVKSIAKLKSITSKKLGVSMKDLRSKLIQIASSEDEN